MRNQRCFQSLFAAAEETKRFGLVSEKAWNK
jgi:hypothetical protein